MENFWNCYKSFHQRPFVIIVLGVLCLVPKCAALTLLGNATSYARYPTWSGCPNASFSFEFLIPTAGNRGPTPQLLWYVDDGGNVDFFVLTLESNRIKLVLRTVAETDGSVEIVGGNRVADGRWHRVEVRRRRMETLLDVDGTVNSIFTFGADFDFGSGANSDVYIGGLPSSCLRSLERYSLPSACLTFAHFSGKIRNVVYNNCTCQLERVSMLEGDGAVQGSEDQCEQSNPCQDCLCISEDMGNTKCNCSNLQCTAVTHYELPMDEIKANAMVNPSGLDAKAFGSPALFRGIRKRAIVLDGKDKYIKVSGPVHRYECFGDLDRCPSGYTLGLWIHFLKAGDATACTFLSNGGHSVENHGVAMLYSRRTLEVRFKKKNGDQWIAISSDVLPQRWLHVAASWHPDHGIFLYINGELVHRVSSPTSGTPVDVRNISFSDFIIGRPNDATQANKICQMKVDDFNFWSVFKSEEQIRETGPFFHYFSSMNSWKDIVNSNLKAQVRGSPGLVPGKIGKAMTFRTGGDYIEGGSLNETCLGNLTLCQYGITVSMWIFFTDLQHDAYILSTGNQAINLYYKGGELKGEVWEGHNHWVTSWTGAETNRWYFLELSWLMGDWLRLYINLKQIIENQEFEVEEPPQFSGSNFYVARGNGNLQNMGAFIVDDLELWYGDRDVLISFDFIARDRPVEHNVTMDAIENSTLVHPDLRISLFGEPSITRGQLAGALNLDGQDKYLSLGPQETSCLGNLDLCRQGLLLSAWLKFGRLREGMDILSSGSNGLQIRYIASQVNIRARTSVREWTVRTDAITDDVWIFLEIGWDPYKGLSLYVDNDLVSQNSTSTLRSDAIGVSLTAQQFYIGRGDGTESGASYGNLTIDDFEYWFGNREYLIAFGYLQRGRPRQYIIYMDLIRDKRIPHQDLNITVYGNPAVVPGKINNAISLNGNNQYVDLGSHEDVCLGYLEDCNNGLTGSIFLNFRSFRENMSCLSSGGGVRLFFSGQKLVVLLHEKRNQWRVEIPDLVTDKWYFFEYTWHRTNGLRVFVNNVMAGRQDSSTVVSSYPRADHFLIGKGNMRDGLFTFADVFVDEVQVWYADRDQLLAFDYLLRDRVTYIVFTMGYARANTIMHPDYTVTMHNGARLVPGKVGNSVLLEGSGEYVTFEEQRQNCMRNLKNCKHGLTIAFLINPRQLISDSYILCSGSYSIFFKDNKLFGKFSLPTKTWELSTDRIGANIWTKFEVSWDESRGLLFYVNGSLANSTFTSFNHSTLLISDYMVYLGRPNGAVVGGQYANATVDELEFWFANRDHLKAFNVISDEISHLVINMDSIRGDVVVHPTSIIYVHGSPVTTNGIIGSGVLLNGQEQFINISGDVGCRGDLQSCPHGFTLRFKIKPNQLSENTYFVSGSILDVFYQNKQLVVKVHTTSKYWVASTKNFQLGIWQQVEVSWHSVDGLTLYINTREVYQKTAGTRISRPYNDVKVLYVGRFHSDMQQKIYASAVFDDFQFFESRREYLIPDLINPDRDLELIRAAYPTTLPVTVTPTVVQVLTVTPGFLPGASKWLVFDGSAWVRFSFSHLPDYYRWRNISTQSFRMTFQTTSPDGLLWLSGNSSCYFTLGLKDGKIKLVLNRTVSSATGSRLYEEVFKPGQNLQLDDSVWHSIIFTQHRDGLVKVVIDGQEFSKQFVSYIDLVNPDFLYFGGIDNTLQQSGSFFSENFNGTVSEGVIFDDTYENILNLILITVTEPLPAYVHQEGRVTFVDPVPPEPQPFTFTGERAYVRVPVDVAREISIELRFRTFEPNSLVLFIEGMNGFLCLELFDGLLYLNLGSNHYPFEKPSEPLNDGHLHLVKFSLSQRTLQLDLDGVTSTFISGNVIGIVGFQPFVFIGGVTDPSRLPRNIWSYDRPFFHGCLSGIRINHGKMVDLEQYVEGQIGFKVGCPDFSSHCVKSPCIHGICSERSVGRYCDCSGTQFTGSDCEIDAQFVGFSGEDHLRFIISQANVTHTNDVSLRFKGVQENSFLFSLSNRQTGQYLRALLFDGFIKIETNIGKNETLQLSCEHPLNDNQWHTLRLKRRPGYLRAFVDGCFDLDSSGSSGELGYTFAVDEIHLGKSGHHDYLDDAFVGYFQNFYLNGYQFFEVLKEGSSNRFPQVSVNSTVHLMTEEVELFVFSVTFSRQAYVTIKFMEFRMGSDRTVHFVLRTSDPNGLLLYNHGLLDQFFAVELVDGILQVSANDASGAQVVRAAGTQLSDGRWHVVDIRETAPKNFKIVIDKIQRSFLMLPSSRNTLDLLGKFYVGGAPDAVLQQLPAVVKSRKGFTGCLAALTVDGKLIDLSKDPEDQLKQSPNVFKGCINDTTKFCAARRCHNGGLCIEGINSFRCDCKLTTFAGYDCSAEAEGYKFGLEGAGGVVVFNMTPLETVVYEALALGFMTWSANGTLLSLRSSSSSSSHFFEVRLVNGFVTIRYDFGNGIQEVVEIGRKFNDGRYHRFSFQSIGTNFNLQVDDLPVRLFSLQGSSSEIFRSLNLVEVGARTDIGGIIINPFLGIISGVFVNGYQIIELGVNQKDTRVKVFGDTVIASHPFFVPEKRPDEVLPTKSVIIDGGGGGVGWGSNENVGDEIVLIPGSDPVAKSQVGGAGYSRAEEGGRAAAVSGAMLALLAVVSSLMWAMYRCKPGIVGQVKVDFDTSTSAETSMLHSARKSISDVGAGDACVSQINPGYESWNFVSSDTSGRNLARASFSHEMSLMATSGSQASTGLSVGSSNQEINLGRNVETIGLGQERSQVTMGHNVSTQMVLGSNSAGNIGRTGVGQEMSQVTTSSRKISAQMIIESKSAGSVGQSGLGQDVLQVMKSGQKVSTEMVVEFNGSRNFGGTGLSQERSQVTTGQNASTQMVLGSSSAGNIGRTGLGQEMKQVTTSGRKISTQVIVETNTGGNIGGTGLGQEMSQFMTSGHNASMQMVDTSKVSKSQVPSVIVTVTGHGAPVTKVMEMETKSAERKEELIQLSGKKKIVGKNLSPTEPYGVKLITSLEKSSSSIQGQVFNTSVTRMQDRGSGFSAKTSSTVAPGSRDLILNVSSDRSIPLMQGMPPKTLKLESPLSEGSGKFSVECRDLKVNASLDRNVPSVRGQPPKTLKLGSPMQLGGSDFPADGNGDLQVRQVLERSSSSIQGQLPKTLKIESPVHSAGAGGDMSIQKSVQSTFTSGSVTSPTVWSTTGPPLSSRHQSSSTFTETKHLAGGTILVESFASTQGIRLNSQLPSLSLTSKKYQIRNLPLNISQEELYKHKIPTVGEPHWQMQGAMAGLHEAAEIGAGHPPVATETIRVECILMTTNGQYLITGSTYGPPQVWDMKTGECLKTMEGGDLSSTDLHLANNDTLLTGQVADVERFNPNIVPGGLHYRRLQIWDFASGRCLKMRNNEPYTASFLMRDGEHVILCRTETNAIAASSVVIVIWDILGNQPERQISYSLENLPTDHVTYVSQSADKRFVVAGFKNPRNGNATYLTFDLTVSNFDVVPPTVIELAAEVQVTIILENHEAVTGTKSGALVVWSLRTGRQHGQLVAPPAEVTGGRAHQMEVKDIVVSKDGQYLVSASSDCTLKLWNLEVIKHVRTFIGHSDEVSCCAISNDNELIVSGSRDQTIRLWRLDNGILVTSVLTSADIFRVLLSNDKKTIAALADRGGARKLVMLQVVRTKTKQSMGSHGESPDSPNSPFSP